jgi:hypothetical protein
MTDFLKELEARYKSGKKDETAYYSQAFNEATRQTGRYSNVPRDAQMAQARQIREPDQISVYGLGSAKKAYNLYDDKNYHASVE